MPNTGESARLHKKDNRPLISGSIREARKLQLESTPLKPNGHKLDCVCRKCFEEWLLESNYGRSKTYRLIRSAEGRSHAVEGENEGIVKRALRDHKRD